MGWLWWVLMAVLVGGVLWWLTTRTKPRPEVYDAPGVGGDERGSSAVGTSADLAAAEADVEVPSDAPAPADSAEDSSQQVTESFRDEQAGESDVEFADASVAYQGPGADPSYTPTHLAPTGTSADAPTDASVDTAEVSEGRYGPGSAEPLADGSAPGAVYTIKGNLESMRFHGPESPYYNRATAEVWFTDADTARSAGFTPWNEL